jgi:hypothetical protein
LDRRPDGKFGVGSQNALMQFRERSPWFCALLVHQTVASFSE